MKTILVVDDESVIAELLADVLSEVGYRVVLARHGREALAVLAVARIDLVMCDVMMPVLDGVALCREIQSAPSHWHIPVVLMSAAQKGGLPQGCSYAAFVSKPFQIDALLALVDQLLR